MVFFLMQRGDSDFVLSGTRTDKSVKAVIHCFSLQWTESSGIHFYLLFLTTPFPILLTFSEQSYHFVFHFLVKLSGSCVPKLRW